MITNIFIFVFTSTLYYLRIVYKPIREQKSVKTMKPSEINESINDDNKLVINGTVLYC